MVTVFITNVKSEIHSNEILQLLQSKYPQLQTNFDLDDFHKPYPCGHSILRIEGESIDTNPIARFLKSKGIECEVLEDKICV